MFDYYDPERWQQQEPINEVIKEQNDLKPKKPKKERRVLKFVGKSVAAALIFCIVASAGFYGVNKAFNIFPTGAIVSGNTSAISGTAVSTATAVNDISDLVKNVMPSIVKVTNVSVRQYQGFFGQLFQQEFASAGSGFIIAKDSQYIYVATNNHVINNAKETTITFFDEEAVEGTVQGAYQDKDVAVVKVAISDIPSETFAGIKVATLGDSSKVEVGQGAVVIGNALGYGTSVTAGIVSALDREVSVQDDTGYTITNNLIQTDASVNQGNSGGPLFNLKGEVIGIVSVRNYTNEADNIGYAIPINQAAEIMDQLLEKGQYTPNPSDEDIAAEGNGAYLGIYGGVDIDEQTASQYNMPMGVYVSAVVEGSPAEEAGIEKGDIITKFDGKEVTKMTELQEIIKDYNPGDEVSVTFAIASNNYMEKTSRVNLDTRPKDLGNN